MNLLGATAIALVTCSAAPLAADCPRKGTLGTSRILSVDAATYPRVGLKNFPQTLPLADHEVVLTFDDGPWPTTPAVLKALAEECTKGLFFPVGKHTTYHPEILKQVFAAGHTVGSHTWSHAHLDSKKMTEPQMKEEIE
jgi:peptidoglycan/xylan/chitin deacetylase (PgdA/CDA1 family)